MKMKLFKYGYLIRHAFDLGRIFPIIIKQRGISKLIAGISSQIINAPTTVWTFIINLDHQFAKLFSVVIPRWVSDLSLKVLNSYQLDAVVQSVLG